MKPFKIFTIIGARPQFIKAAAVSHTIKNYKEFINETIIHTGQHFDFEMSERFFKELDIPIPSFNLGIGGGTHGQNTGRMIEKIEKILIKDKPDGILVYGDTDSTLAAALAASKLNIPIFHIEAGLRSHNRYQPEEQNRILTDHLSDLCFCPTKLAIKNLQKEGLPYERIIKTGDVMADATRIYSELSFDEKILSNFNLESKKFILLTIHREENTDDKKRLENILKMVNSKINKYANTKNRLKIILPIHPRTKNRIAEYKFESLIKNFIITDPLGFRDMILLEKHSKIIITDSGGIQKEAFFQRTPCVTIRSETEWTELIESGWNILADPSEQEKISDSINLQLNFDNKKEPQNFYGDGFAADEIIKKIINYLDQLTK